jgi:hypothetical protein
MPDDRTERGPGAKKAGILSLTAGHSLLPASLAVTIMIIGGCSLLQTVPVDEQSYLQYRINRGYGGTCQATLRFKNAPRNMIEVTVEQPVPPAEPAQSITSEEDASPEEIAFSRRQETPVPVIAPDDNNKILVSRFFTRKGGYRLELESFGPLWLPTIMLVPGRTVNLGFMAGDVVVGQETVWNTRRVVPLRKKGGDPEARGVWYYSPATGFLVGFDPEERSNDESGEAYSRGLVLAETNIEGLLSVGSAK